MTVENRSIHVRAERTRGETALRAARELLALGLVNDAVSRAYYAALHFAVALLLTEGVEPRSHGGVGSMLGLHFVLPGKLPPESAKELSRLEQFRGEADYNRFFTFTEQGAREEVDVAISFCDRARRFLEEHGWRMES